jgi:hypothetical protein
MRKVALAMVLLTVLALLLSSCAAGQNGSSAKGTPPVTTPENTAAEPTVAVGEGGVTFAVKSDLSFQNVAFGSTWDEVSADKTLKITKTYMNAMDAEPVVVYSYRMQPTFWFDSAGQFFSGSYSMEQKDYVSVTGKLQDRLTVDYGEPAEVAFYNFDDQPVTFPSEEEAIAAIGKGNAFYCVTYNCPDGLQVELYVQSVNSDQYQYYIYYTDPAL